MPVNAIIEMMRGKMGDTKTQKVAMQEALVF
jgi:hypothetical protein